MTTEQKAKAYDKVSKEVKDFFEGRQKMYSDVEQTLEYLFPELVESEDERIKHEIRVVLANTDFSQFALDYTFDDMVAWLEKQGENTYNKELSELLHKVICRFINDPDIPYSDREKVSMKVLPYVERLEKQGEQILANSAKTCKDEQKPTDGEMKEALHTEYEKGRADAITEMQKHTWSEEDENFFNDTIAFFEDTKNALDHANWIKSLKQRIVG